MIPTYTWFSMFYLEERQKFHTLFDNEIENWSRIKFVKIVSAWRSSISRLTTSRWYFKSDEISRSNQRNRNARDQHAWISFVEHIDFSLQRVIKTLRIAQRRRSFPLLRGKEKRHPWVSRNLLIVKENGQFSCFLFLSFFFFIQQDRCKLN